MHKNLKTNMLNLGTLNIAYLNGGTKKSNKTSGGVIDDGYIRFKDPEVLRVLLANGVGADGGVTEEEAAAVTSIGTWFNGNTVIETFDEFEKFIGVVVLGNNNIYTSPFYKCTSLKRIKLPNSINRLNAYSFAECASLESIPDLTNVTNVGPRVFSSCIAMNGIVNIPNFAGDFVSGEFYSTGISKVQSLGQMKQLSTGSNNTTSGSFGQCLNLESVILPDSLTRIGQYCFYGCPKLSNIYIPKSMKIINNSAFSNCTSLAIEDLSLPNLETLGQNAFYGVKIKKISNLGKITALPAANGSSRNFGDKSVLEEIVFPETVTDIPTNSFFDYTALSKYNLSHVKTISSSAFKNTPYKDVVDLSSIVTLNDSAILGTNWGKIIIGENCTTIAQYNFWQLKSTPILIVRAVTPPSLAGNNNMNFCSVIYVTDASVTAYREASGWSTYASRIKPLSEYTE